jgi:hypothetical protein
MRSGGGPELTIAESWWTVYYGISGMVAGQAMVSAVRIMHSSAPMMKAWQCGPG